MNGSLNRLVLLCAAVTAFGCPALSAVAREPAAQPAGQPGVQSEATTSGSYTEYIAAYADRPRLEPLTLTPSDYDPAGSSPGLDSKMTVAGGVEYVEIGHEQWISFPVSVPRDGLYSLALTYKSAQLANTLFTASLELDGAVPFLEADGFELPKIWEDIVEGGRYEQDDFGNEIAPQQRELDRVQTTFMRDRQGYYAEPYDIHFSQGEHRLTVRFDQAGILLSHVLLTQEAGTVTYADYIQEHEREGAAGADAATLPLKLQAEDMAWKSDSMLVPYYDNSSSATEPSNPSKSVLNCIGGMSWAYPGQSVSWRVEVKAGGFYKLDVRARQNLKRGVMVGRKILIDGQVPFREAESYMFPFSSEWYVHTVGGDKPYLFYLPAGEHTVTLEVAASYPEIVRELSDNVVRLNEFYRKIIMITGTQPDQYTDYELDKRIAGFEEWMKSLEEDLQGLVDDMLAGGFQKGGEIETINLLLTKLRDFQKNQMDIPLKMSGFQDNVTTLAAWISLLSEQPLELDYLRLAPPDAASPKANDSFFTNAAFIFKRFLSSFTNDYTRISAQTGEESISVWLSLGRDQAQVVKRLMDDDFYPKYRIRAQLNLVQQTIAAQPGVTSMQHSLSSATLTGQGPDVVLFVPPNDVINLAARGVLEDLSRYDTFDNVLTRFHEVSAGPYTYEGACYAIPVAENFNIMFYRKDIFESLGLEPPTTWDEFYDVLTVLQRNNLTAGIPNQVPNTSGAPIFTGETVFQTLLFQHGGGYYRDNWSAIDFNSPQGMDAFHMWTDMHSKYSLPVEFDFYTRFRSGEMPIGFENYVFYNKLSVSAPELRGLWAMMPVPGLEKDGAVNNMVSGGGTGAIMFSKTANKEAAWDFIDWWTSAETQARYAREIEMLMGPAGRYETANVEAFKTLGWNKQEREILLEQWDRLQLVEQTPASYYVSRNVAYAFKRVVIQKVPAREALNMYCRDINKEIDRLQKELLGSS